MIILIVDDEALERKALKMKITAILDKEITFFESGNGFDAVKNAKETNPDIIFMDIKMPIMSGLDAANAIISLRPSSNIVITTAYNEFSFAQQSIRLGVKNYLLKPIDVDELKAAFLVIIPRQEEKSEEVCYGHPSIESAVCYLKKNYFRNISMEEVAEKVYLNPSYFSRLFKQKTNLSFCEYLAKYRIAEAKKLLIDTTYSIGLIAEMVGYKDTRYFTQIFKQHEQVSPTKYRTMYLMIASRDKKA